MPTTEPEFKARPTTFEIVANLKTTKAHGIALPATLHACADEEIELAFFCCAANARFWHKADIPRLSSNVRFWGQSGHWPKAGEWPSPGNIGC